MKELFVYYDPEYDPDCTRRFISPSVSELIVEFLKSKEFQVLSAQKLREVMLSVLKQEKQKVVIVFAQDVAPDTILDDISATALVRQYLDSGGTIVWVGDIPFFYQARKGGQKRDDKWWQKGAAANILGVNPIFPASSPRAKITKEGRNRGLRVAWSGIRPIIIRKGIKVLAESKYSFGMPHVPVLRNWWSRQLDRLRGIKLGASTVTVGIELDEPRENILMNKKLANAWFKNFDSDNPNSGFIRIWDYRPAVLTEQKLEDLYRVATFIV